MRRLQVELVIDSFAGGGGASLGIEQAIGRRYVIEASEPFVVNLTRCGRVEALSEARL